jgi:hypothetical protein
MYFKRYITQLTVGFTASSSTVTTYSFNVCGSSKDRNRHAWLLAAYLEQQVSLLSIVKGSGEESNLFCTRANLLSPAKNLSRPQAYNNGSPYFLKKSTQILSIKISVLTQFKNQLSVLFWRLKERQSAYFLVEDHQVPNFWEYLKSMRRTTSLMVLVKDRSTSSPHSFIHSFVPDEQQLGGTPPFFHCEIDFQDFGLITQFLKEVKLSL